MKIPILFRQRWFFSLLGIIALAFLIWYLGPLIAIGGKAPLASPRLRLFCIGGLVLLWCLWWGWRWWQAVRRNRELAAGMAQVDEVGRAAAEEEAILKERFNEVLRVLQRARFKGQKLYQLPWYVVIGPPGVGKTTLLVNSNLRFPLADRFGREAVRGVGGTRNCDWWFAEEAVLLDTAGRYTTQESHQEVDRSAWLAFLELLKKYRPRRPLNGVIVVIGMAELLTQDEPSRHASAQAIRKRIHELYQHLGIRLPVYFIVNKGDLLAGFNDYFDDLTPEERNQVWGMTFPLQSGQEQAEAPVQRFANEFGLLEARLFSQLNTKLARETNLERREHIYLFPHQFNSVQPVLKEFMEEIFTPSHFEEPILLRGVYFTSATQEGTPIDRILGSLARTFNLAREALPRFSGKGRAFFINDLLRQVVFAEAGLAGTDWRLEQRMRWLRGLAVGTTLVVTVGVGSLWVMSALNNRSHAHEAQAQARALQQAVASLDEQSNLQSWLGVLGQARQLANLADEESWARDFGLSQDDKLGEASRAIYHRLLIRGLLPSVIEAMEEGIHDFMGDPRGLYRALRVYLMLDNPDHYEPETVRGWIKDYWETTVFRALSAEQRRSLMAHLDSLLAERPVPLPRSLDAELIEQARVSLASRPLALQVYDSLKSAFPADRIEPFVPSKVMGPEGMLIVERQSGRPLTEGMSGLFTYDGYHTYYTVASGRVVDILKQERWVFGKQYAVTPEILRSLHQEVLDLYAKEYIKKWQELLADVTFIPPRNLSHAREMLKILSGRASPFKRWLVAVAKQTNLQPRPKNDKVPVIPLPAPIAKIGEYFTQLQRMVEPQPEGGAAPIDAVLGQVNDMYVQLEAFQKALESGNPELITEQGRRVKTVVEDLQLALSRQPPAVAEPLGHIARNSKLLVAGGRRKYLQAMWKSEVLPFCQKAIAGRYPIAASSARDITLADFARFFGPNGLMAHFFDQYLAQSVDRSRSPWRWNPHEGTVLSRRALKQFEIAETIRNIFFGTSAQPMIRFSLEPISMSMEAVRAEMDIDGQRLVYEHGPIQPQWFRWPGRETSNVVRLRFLPPVSARASGTSRSGPWAWLRLLDDGKVVRTALPEQFLVTFTVGGRYLKLTMRASSAFNPFGSQVIHRFRCLPNL